MNRDQFLELLANSETVTVADDSVSAGHPADAGEAVDLLPAVAPPTATPFVVPTAASHLELRRVLRKFLIPTTRTANDLADLKAGKSIAKESAAYAVIAAVAIDMRYPADEESVNYRAALQQATAGDHNDFVDEAIDELAAIVRIVEKARFGLEMLDTFRLPLPAIWSTLPADELARSINQYCHAAFGAAFLR